MVKLSRKSDSKSATKKVNKNGKKKSTLKSSKKLVSQTSKNLSDDLTKSLNHLASRIKSNIDKIKDEDSTWHVEELNNSFKTTKDISSVNTEKENASDGDCVSYNQVKAGVGALLQFLQTQIKKNELFNEDEPIFLQIVAVKIPKTPRFLLRIPLPNSLVMDTSDICLFVPDLHKGRKTDHEPTVQHYEDLLRSKGISNIKGIIPMRQVKVEYDQYELRRRLLARYDFFLTDARISKHLNRKLGKIFNSKRKTPTPIRLDAKDLKKEIQLGLSKVPLLIHGSGDTSVVQVGHVEQKIKKITDNIMAVVKYLARKYPGGWNNIRSLYIKTDKSIAIPIYISLKRNTEVSRPRVLPKRPKAYHAVEDELSTTINKYVKVHPSGHIKIVKKKETILNDSNESEESDMEEQSDLEQSIHDEQLSKEIEYDSNNEGRNEEISKKRNKDESGSESESDDDNLINNAEEQYLQNYQDELQIQNEEKKLLKAKQNKSKQKKLKQK